MSTRQRIYAFIRDYIAANGWAPTYSEIMAETGIASRSTIAAHLANLQRDGLIVCGHAETVQGTARMIRLTDKEEKCQNPPS